MASKLILSAVIVLSLAAMAATGEMVRVAEDGPPRSLRIPCDHEANPGWSCLDCKTRLLCTPLGGIRLPCLLPGRNCVNGSCSSEPSDECAGPPPPGPPPSHPPHHTRPPPSGPPPTGPPPSGPPPTGPTTEQEPGTTASVPEDQRLAELGL